MRRRGMAKWETNGYICSFPSVPRSTSYTTVCAAASQGVCRVGNAVPSCIDWDLLHRPFVARFPFLSVICIHFSNLAPLVRT